MQDLEDYQGAKILYERALRIVDKQLGENHPYAASSANNLGIILQALGDLQGAKALYERAFKIDELIFSIDHPKIAIDANNLGSLLYAQEDYAGAKPYFVLALAIFRKFLGEEHLDTKIVKGWLVRVEEALRKEDGG